MPGTQYPNLRLVDFIRRWKAGPAWPKNYRPRVLELGFGSIANMRMLAIEGCDVHGLEVSEDAVQSALNAIEIFNLKEHLSVSCFNGVTLSESVDSFDAIIGLQSVYYNLEQKEFANDCARLLKPGGLLFFSFFTTRHGYMSYINGEPGGPVTFTESHPNPKLPGLEVFLYRDKSQFQEIYGRHFDIDVDIYETDLLPVYQSWQYLRGQKKDRPALTDFRAIGSNPTLLEPSEYLPNPTEDGEKTASNMSVLDSLTALSAGTEKTILQDYPNIEIIRFLATWSRRQKNDYFRHIVGQEMKSTEVDGLKALEINTLCPSHILAMDRFKYKSHGVCLGKKSAEDIETALANVDVDHKPVLEVWDGHTLPFESDNFEVAFSLASSVICNQDALVKEAARTVAVDGEIFMAYVSPRAGVLENSEHLGGNFYRLQDDFDELNRKGMILFVATDEDLEGLWSPYFDVTINHFEFAGLSTHLSYQVVSGNRRATSNS